MENNAYESELLAKLQIEVESVISTELALAQLADPQGGNYDLVISDWTGSAEVLLAGRWLLQAMRACGHDQPVVIFRGAFGEAVLPGELMGLVQGALRA